MKTFLFALLLTTTTLHAQDIYEGIDYSQTDVTEESFATKEKSKTNIIGKSHVELLFNSSGSTSATTLNYVITPQLLVGISSHRISTIGNDSGGNLDSGQYFSSSYGYVGTAASVGAKYFVKDHGIQSHGLFLAGQVGRRWGKYTYSQDRYERENGFFGNMFGVDKKLVESSTDQAYADAEVLRATVGYTLPFVDGILLKGVSLQLQAGLESNSLPDSKYLSTKFGTKDVGAGSKSNVYLDMGVAAYF